MKNRFSRMGKVVPTGMKARDKSVQVGDIREIQAVSPRIEHNVISSIGPSLDQGLHFSQPSKLAPGNTIVVDQIGKLVPLIDQLGDLVTAGCKLSGQTRNLRRLLAD